ncbi:hypothetical protein [Burkholderia cepacia]|uniref:hypothetical protein n=1 Tax=Burkholderia cepacia TaxID=292 RepID=UPI000ACABBA5
MTMRRTCTWRLLEDLDRFTDRFVATCGGSKSKPGAFQVTSTFGQTISRLVFMPCRSISHLPICGNVVHPAPTSATGRAPRKPAHRPHCSHFTLRKRSRC